jgi:hypothetical protein
MIQQLRKDSLLTRIYHARLAYLFLAPLFIGLAVFVISPR